MNENTKIYREYYQKVFSHPHSKRTEFAVRLNNSGNKVAIDCGCGSGSDIEYLSNQHYQVYGFDINPDSIAICLERFPAKSHVEITQSSFESFDYPKVGIILANSSLFFAEPIQFIHTWAKIESSLAIGGVFAGDFMGVKDSWACNYHTTTMPLTESQVKALFVNFEIVRFHERDEQTKTSLGKLKHWHTFSLVAVKCR